MATKGLAQPVKAIKPGIRPAKKPKAESFPGSVDMDRKAMRRKMMQRKKGK